MEVHYALVHNNYSGTQNAITAVHNTYMTQKHLERQVASTMISVLASTLTSRCYGVVVRGAKKHYVNVKTEQTLSTLRPRK